MIEKQIELEKQMTQCSINNYRNELEKAKQKDIFGITPVATRLISRILDTFKQALRSYQADYTKGKAVRSTMAADVIGRLDTETVAYITAKIIFNGMYSVIQVQNIYKAIGQWLEDEYKMREFKTENSHYYKSIQEDLNKRGVKANRKKNITTGVFNKRLDFHLERWTITEKFNISEDEANWWFMYQTLIGDAVDGYFGCKGVGDKTARKILGEIGEHSL